MKLCGTESRVEKWVRSVLHLVFCVFALGVLWSTSAAAQGLPPCASDWDCEPCHTCDVGTGECVPPPPGVECEKDSDCGAGGACSPCGICVVAECNGNVDCGDCGMCLAGTCVPLMDQCQSDFDCYGAELCVTDSCGGTVCQEPEENVLEKELCLSTGGLWQDLVCGHKLCDQKLECSKLTTGCECGIGKTFGENGCFEDPACPTECLVDADCGECGALCDYGKCVLPDYWILDYPPCSAEGTCEEGKTCVQDLFAECVEGCVPDEELECKTTEDCGGCAPCTNNQCVWEGLGIDECGWEGLECPAGLICSGISGCGKVCVEPESLACTTDEDCVGLGTGCETCNGGICEENIVHECFGNECPLGSICIQSQCGNVCKPILSDECTDDEDCGTCGSCVEGTCNSGGQSECSEGAPCAAGFICVESVCGGVCEEDPYADLKAECAEKGMEFQAIVDDCDPQPTCNNPEGTPPEVCDSYPGDPGCVCPDTAPVFDPLKGCITKEECPVETSGSESPEESEESGTESSDEPNEEPGDASEESEPDSEESSENEGTGDSVNAASDGCETGGSTARGAGWILLFCWMAVARRQKISQWG